MVDRSVRMMLVWKMFWEMDARPFVFVIEVWPQMDACRTEKCLGCGRLVYDRLEVLERVRKCLVELPDTV